MIDEPLPGGFSACGEISDADREFVAVTLPDNMLLRTRDETDFG
jgi:hypothetical protein